MHVVKIYIQLQRAVDVLPLQFHEHELQRVVVLKEQYKRYPDLVRYLWTHKGDFDTVLDECFYISERFLEDKNLKEKLVEIKDRRTKEILKVKVEDIVDKFS